MTENPLPTPAFARTVRGSGPGLVLAHGAGGSIAANYGPILDGLADGRTVVGADYPGSGQTPLPAGPLSLEALAGQLVAAANAEGLASFAVAGWSPGAPVAIRAATRHPGRVTALVLTAPFARPDTRLKLATTLWRDLYNTGDPALVLRFLMLMARGEQALEEMTPETYEAAMQMAPQIIPPGTPAQTDVVRSVDVRADLPAITAPTLVISTTADRLVAPALHREVAEGIPGARLAELNTGHLAGTENPQQWLKLITAFLDRTTRVPHDQQP